MKIDSSKPLGNSSPSAGASSASTGTTRAGKGAAGSGGAAGARVEISRFSSQLQSIQSSMASEPAVDVSKVAEIKMAIAEGRFKVNPDAVADHLLQAARELISSRMN